MRIELIQPYLSIKKLNAVEIPDFTMLIGRNGVGKTQLLTAIKNGNVTVSEVPNSEIEFFDLDSFKPQDSPVANWSSSSFAERTAERFFGKQSDFAPVEAANQIFHKTVEEFSLTECSDERHRFECKLRNEIAKLDVNGNFPQLNDSDALTAYTSQIQREVINPFSSTNRRERNRRERNTKSDPALLICLTMKLNSKLPHEIGRDDILRAANFEGSIIQNALSESFTRYKVEQYSWAHNEGEKGHDSFQDLMSHYRHLNAPPWLVLRENLALMREAAGDPELFNFDFSDPEEDKINFANHTQYSFVTSLSNRATGDVYSVTNLSSGEKILMTLFLAAFNQSIGRRLPKVVLLDEIDVVLHPSMISALIVGLKNQFVANDTNVIMATHSLTTVAMLNEGEIFRVSRKGNAVDVSAVTKSAAISDLSEGIATIDTGLRIATSNVKPITILTEGDNALHLKKWASLFFPDDVDVFDRLPDKTGASQLKSYGRLLAHMNTNSHFLIVLDCDAKKTADELADEWPETTNVTAFAFEHRENSIASKGIENKYDERFLKPYAIRSTEYATDKEISLSFASGKKLEFAHFIRENGNHAHFKHFDDLQMVVNSILHKRRHIREDP